MTETTEDGGREAEGSYLHRMNIPAWSRARKIKRRRYRSACCRGGVQKIRYRPPHIVFNIKSA